MRAAGRPPPTFGQLLPDKMPEQNPDPIAEQVVPEPELSAGFGSSLLGKLAVLLFVAVVIAGECLVAVLLLPTASETTVMATATLDRRAQAAELPLKPSEPEEKEEELIDQMEVDLGDFNVTSYQPLSQTTLRLDFHLYGTVGADEKAEFDIKMEESTHRFREQVIVIMRSSEITDLTDAGLGLIKRKVLEKSNRIFGKPLLRTIIFSDFSFIEQ